MKKKITLFALLLSTLIIYAQDPNILWQRTIGGSDYDYLYDIKQTPDGGLIFGGGSASDVSGDKTDGSNGSFDMWVIKTDGSGEIQWQNSIGGNQGEDIHSIALAPDGGYLLIGESNSDISGDKTENSRGGDDYWVVKINNTGTVVWDKTYGGDNIDWFPKISASTAGGYYICGSSSSDISGEKTENAIGQDDFWALKIDDAGTILWQDTLGGNSFEQLEAVVATADGGCIIGGYSLSDISGDKTENSRGGSDYWVIKLSSAGNIEWDKTIGGNGADRLHSVIQTTDGGYLLGGYSTSEISGDKTENNIGQADFWVIKLNSTGNIEWQNTIGGIDGDVINSVSQISDGGYILGGASRSNISGDKTENSMGGDDFWIVKINNVGIIEWQNTIGGNQADVLGEIIQVPDGSYILAGNSLSGISGDKTDNSRGNFDFWILKHAQTLGLEENPFFNAITLYPNPTKNTLQLNTQDKTIDQVNIYTIAGSKVLQLDVDTISPTVDVSSLASGVYYVQLYSGKNVALKKFVKE